MGNEELAVCDVGKIAKRPVKNDKHLPIEAYRNPLTKPFNRVERIWWQRTLTHSKMSKMMPPHAG